MDNPLELIQFLIFLTGTLLPVAGFVCAWLVSRLCDNPLKSIILLTVPAVALGISFVFGERLAYNGNMLFAITLLVGSAFAVFIYYPGLILLWIIRYLRKLRK